LFSEEVETTSTNLDRNTLFVEAFEEVFFGVFEFKINNETVIAEKVGLTEDGDPVVTVPVVESNGIKTEASFTLKKGKQQVFYTNEKKQLVVEKVEEPEPEPEKPNVFYVENFEEIHFGIFEFELNGSKVVAESIGKNYKGQPIVEVPVANGTANVVLQKKELVIEEGSTENETILTEDFTLPTNNTFVVDKFEEVYFGMYEFELNGKKVLAEKVDELNGNPVVEVPVGDTKTKIVLKKASVTELLENTVDTSDIVNLEAYEAAPKKAIVDKARKIKTEVKREVLKEFKSDSDAAISKFREETKNVIDEVSRSKDEMFLEFTESNDNYRRKTSKELRDFVIDKISQLKVDNVELANTLNESLKNGLDEEYGSFTSRLLDTQQELKERRLEHKKIAAHINTLEEAQLNINAEFELNKKQLIEATTTSNEAVTKALKDSDKGVNKALSRVGALKKELTDNKEELKAIEETLLWSMNKAEDRAKAYYHEQIQVVEQTISSNIRKDEIIDAVKKSKAMIIAELNDSNGLKEQLRQLAKESANGEFDPISGKSFAAKLKQNINQRFADEMTNIKRMIELGGGGGGIGDAPNDGQTYSRENGQWVLGGGSGGPDAESVFTTVQTYSADWFGGEGEVGPGTINNFSIFTSNTAIGDSIMSQTDDGLGIDINGTTTINGNLSVLGDFTYIDSTVSVTSALSVINDGTSPALYAEQSGVGEPIAKFVDSEGGSVTIGDGGALAADTLSATGRVEGSNISTIENKVEGLYSYLINNFDTNRVTDATDLTDFVTNYSKAGLSPGDVITLSAVNTAYILGDNDGSANTDWLEVNLKPNFLFYRGGITDYTVLDTIPLSAAKSSKYIIQVEDTSDGALFYGEINVVSDGSIAVATEYALNHTTVFPFVEFGAEVIGNRVSLSAMALEGKNMANFTFKGNRSNLFG